MHILKGIRVIQIFVRKGENYENVQWINPETGRENLSPRELECIMYAMKGLTNQEIAKCMFVEETTIKRHAFYLLHLQNLMPKYRKSLNRNLFRE